MWLLESLVEGRSRVRDIASDVRALHRVGVDSYRARLKKRERLCSSLKIAFAKS